MSLSIIVAMSRNHVIGKNNQLPWHLSQDLKRFKALTMGHPIIMGRKTFESIGKPLPGRTNIVLTKDNSYQVAGVQIVHTLNEALQFGEVHEEKFIIGGAGLFKEAYPLADKIYLTLIDQDFEGDVIFPDLNLTHDFKTIEESSLLYSQKNNLPYHFITAERKKV